MVNCQYRVYFRNNLASKDATKANRFFDRVRSVGGELQTKSCKYYGGLEAVYLDS